MPSGRPLRKDRYFHILCSQNCCVRWVKEHSCSCSGSKKTEYNNQWVSPPAAKLYNANTHKCDEEKEKTATNNQWT